MINREQFIAQRSVGGSTSDSASFASPLGASRLILIVIATWPATATWSVNVGGVAATEVSDAAGYGPSVTRLFYAYGAFADALVTVTATEGSYFHWAAEEWSGLELQAPVQVVGATTFSPNHASVMTAAIAVVPSLVVGFAQNDVNADPSEWSPPIDYSIGALNVQQYSGNGCGVLVERVVEDTAAQDLTFTGDGTKNFGRLVAAVFSGLPPGPVVSGENPIMFGANY